MGNSFVTIRCPTCARIAEFEFAKIIKIARKADIPYFENSKHFDVVDPEGWNKHKLYSHGHYRGYSDAVDCSGLENITDLPKGCKLYYASINPRSRSISRHKHSGTVRCRNCNSVSKHQLNWPEEAYFQISYKGKNLWAYDRETATKLLTYIKSKDRKKRIEVDTNYSVQDSFLRKIPEHFQTAKARGIIVKKLEKIIGL